MIGGTHYLKVLNMCMEKIRSLLWSIGMLTTLSVGAESTTALSVNGQGGTADSISDRPVISADGRFVAYQSKAADLVPGDSNTENDIFLHELATNTVTRISLGINGTQSNGGSTSPSISQDGRYVAFESLASNLVANDTTGTNGYQDIFIHDRTTAVTVRVSVSNNGAAADKHALHPAISGDGRFVVFVSAATNLVVGDTNTLIDVFLHDRDPDQDGVFDENNGATVRISPSGTTRRSAGQFRISVADHRRAQHFVEGPDMRQARRAVAGLEQYRPGLAIRPALDQLARFLIGPGLAGKGGGAERGIGHGALFANRRENVQVRPGEGR